MPHRIRVVDASVIAVALLTISLTAFTGATQPQPRFRSGVTIVEIAATVRDRDGAAVKGLTADDFEVLIDDRPVPMESFAAITAEDESEPRTIVLLLDDMLAEPIQTPRMREIARSLVERLSTRDQMAIVALNGDQMASTSDKKALLARIDRFTAFGKRPRGPMSPDEQYTLMRLPFDPVDQALHTVIDVAQQVSASPVRRRALVVIGSPAIFDVSLEAYGRHQLEATRGTEGCTSAWCRIRRSPDSPEWSRLEPSATSAAGEALAPSRKGNEATWMNAVVAAAGKDVPVYVIDPAGLRQGNFSMAAAFTDLTGGLAFTATNNFSRASDRVWSDLANYYLIGFRVPDAPPEQWQRISLKVKRSGTSVTLRRTGEASGT